MNEFERASSRMNLHKRILFYPIYLRIKPLVNVDESLLLFSLPAYPSAAYGQFAQALGQAAQLLPSGTAQREGTRREGTNCVYMTGF